MITPQVQQLRCTAAVTTVECETSWTGASDTLNNISLSVHRLNEIQDVFSDEGPVLKHV